MFDLNSGVRDPAVTHSIDRITQVERANLLPIQHDGIEFYRVRLAVNRVPYARFQFYWLIRVVPHQDVWRKPSARGKTRVGRGPSDRKISPMQSSRLLRRLIDKAHCCREAFTLICNHTDGGNRARTVCVIQRDSANTNIAGNVQFL